MSQVAETTLSEEGAFDPQSSSHGNGDVNSQGHAKGLAVDRNGHVAAIPKPKAIHVHYFELFNENRLKTVSYCVGFWTFGTCIGFLGPTLIDLECRLDNTYISMSWVFFTQALFTLIGAAIAGFVVQRISNNLALLISTIMIAITLAVIPACKHLLTLATVLAVMGIFMGIIDTVANISMIQLYGTNVSPFLQALHFFYGLGAFGSPILAEPFLLNGDCTKINLNTTTAGHELQGHGLHGHGNYSDPLHHVSEAGHNSRIQFLFWILAAIQTPVIGLFFMLVMRDIKEWGPSLRNPPTESSEDNSGDLELATHGVAPSKLKDDHHFHPIHKKKDRPVATKRQTILVTGLAALIIFLYDGLQVGFGGYIFSYAVKSIEDMSMKEAAYLTSCFWGTFAFGRLVSIAIATKLSPSFMLLCNITGCSVATGLMLVFRHSRIVMYVGTLILGTFLSSTYPTAISVTETYVEVTSFVASVLVTGAATGEMLLPVIIGHEFDALGPISLLVSGVLICVASIILYVVLHFIGENILKQTSKEPSENEETNHMQNGNLKI